MSQSTTAAVRQYEMNVNITLLTTITWAVREGPRPTEKSPKHLGRDQRNFKKKKEAMV